LSPDLVIRNVLKTQRNQGDLWPSLYTKKAMDFYSDLSLCQKEEFLLLLAKDFAFDVSQVESLIQHLSEVDKEKRHAVLYKIRKALNPAYEQFFDRVNQLPDGLAQLSQMRSDLLVRFILWF
jgi:hypothetical protein